MCRPLYSDIDKIRDIYYDEHQAMVSQAGMGSQDNISHPLEEGGRGLKYRILRWAIALQMFFWII